MPVRASALLIGAAAVVALAIAAAVYLLGGDGGGYEPRLTPEYAEGVAGKQARDVSSPYSIGCDVIAFREDSRTWLVECHQDRTTRWVVDDQTEEVRPADEASRSPTETANLGNGGGGTLDGSRLLTSARDRLAICVQAVNLGDMESSLASQAKTTIESTLADLASDPAWVELDLSSPPPVVDLGCPAAPALYDPQAGPRDDNTLFLVRGRDVGQASYYRVFVFILTDVEIARWAGTSNYRLTAEENLCEVGVCAEATTGIYLRTGEVAKDGLLEENLRVAVGLP